ILIENRQVDGFPGQRAQALELLSGDGAEIHPLQRRAGEADQRGAEGEPIGAGVASDEAVSGQSRGEPGDRALMEPQTAAELDHPDVVGSGREESQDAKRLRDRTEVGGMVAAGDRDGAVAHHATRLRGGMGGTYGASYAAATGSLRVFLLGRRRG